jgi:hypothetical protein
MQPVGGRVDHRNYADANKPYGCKEERRRDLARLESLLMKVRIDVRNKHLRQERQSNSAAKHTFQSYVVVRAQALSNPPNASDHCQTNVAGGVTGRYR